MPHFSIEYSSNLEKKIDIKEFCNTLRLAGIETGVFPTKGIRVRAIGCNHYSIADDNPVKPPPTIDTSHSILFLSEGNTSGSTKSFLYIEL